MAGWWRAEAEQEHALARPTRHADDAKFQQQLELDALSVEQPGKQVPAIGITGVEMCEGLGFAAVPLQQLVGLRLNGGRPLVRRHSRA